MMNREVCESCGWMVERCTCAPPTYLVSDQQKTIDQLRAEIDSNTKLLAAASDLYAACVEVVRKVDVGEARSTRSYAAMKAAIAKARGEVDDE